MSSQFAGWSVEEAVKRVLGPRAGLQRAIDLLPLLESQHLVAYESDPRSESPRRLSLSQFGGVAQAAISADKRSSKQIFGTVVLFPAVCAPDAPSILDGRSLKEVMSKFVIGDPELTRLAPDAVTADPTMQNFIEWGHYYPNGWHEWRVTCGTLDENDLGDYGGSELGVLMFEHDWPNPTVRRVRQLACFRFGMLMRHLSTGAVEAVGDPMRAGDLASILPSIWDHSDYYVCAEKGDVLLINDNNVGRHDQFIRRWAAVILRDPRARSSTEATNVDHWSERVVTPVPEPPLKAEKECCLWLEELMRKSLHYKPKSKLAYRDEAKARWKRLSDRGFDKAWSTAVQGSGAWAWSKAGRPTESGRVEA